jgi:prevent-host-death family protein
MDMTVRTSSSRLKAKLGQYLRAVRAGQEIVVTDRDRPVARLLPFDETGATPRGPEIAFPRDPAAPLLGDLQVRSIRYRGPSTTALLTADRKRR